VVSENETGALILALHRATHATLGALQARLAYLDLTASEINALANLADGRARTIGELVVRQLDPADRRSFLASLTDEGRPVADTARAAIHDIERTALAMVNGADLAGFRAITHALTEASR
jgi:hypothetical protein